MLCTTLVCLHVGVVHGPNYLDLYLDNLCRLGLYLDNPSRDLISLNGSCHIDLHLDGLNRDIHHS